jgi:hypothetical protein
VPAREEPFRVTEPVPAAAGKPHAVVDGSHRP